jgi:hypothetical protein
MEEMPTPIPTQQPADQQDRQARRQRGHKGAQDEDEAGTKDHPAAPEPIGESARHRRTGGRSNEGDADHQTLHGGREGEFRADEQQRPGNHPCIVAE